ncbi:MAG: error-prone DNA polymerase [Pseudomonadota bacterium]
MSQPPSLRNAAPPSSPAAYAELHCISSFSFLRGASQPEELVRQAIALGYRALAITDECSVAGVVRAHTTAKESGLPIIVGSEFRTTAREDGEPPLHLVLLATCRLAYGRLCRLITRARRRAEKGSYVLYREDLSDAAEALDGCLALWLVPPILDASTEATGHWLRERFARRLWIAVELHAGGDDRQRLASLDALGDRLQIPLTAAGDVHMHVRSRRALQDTMTAIRIGTPVAEAGDALFPNGERHLRPIQSLQRFYPDHLLRESVAIAERCHFSLDELRYEYPAELVPPGETPTSHLRKLTLAGMRERWPEGASDDVLTQVKRELELIAELRYEPFFLTVHDVVRYARSQRILCQGRGSAANSAVCYCLGITSVDPSRSNMLFERFISKERNEPPDIDVDFEHERRELVIQYLYRKYGRGRAALAATVITYRARSAVRDVGKALGLDPLQVDRLARTVDRWQGTVDDSNIREAGFDPESAMIRRLLVLVGQLLGFPRHLSQHVGGFVISQGPLAELVPVENAAMDERTVIQWDKDDLEDLGLLKVDVLGLGMLTAIRRAFEMVNGWRGSALGLHNVPAEDPKVYDMICQADTVGVFQIESRAQMSMLPRLKPRRFYDLVIEVAIVRPGPIQGDMVHPYLRRRDGLEPVSYPSDAVRYVLSRTLGVPIFQEQVMELAVVAAGFTPGEADQLRRAMAAWKRRGGLEPFQAKLMNGMRERGYEEAFAEQVFKQIMGFGEYGFPESHAASFSLLVYVSAWLKRYEPAAFAAALLNSQPMGFYAPSQLVQDAVRHGVEVRPVDVHVSEWDCGLEVRGRDTVGSERATTTTAARATPPRPQRRASDGEQAGDVPVILPTGADGPALRLGLRMVKGLAEVSAQAIVKARRQQAFRDVQDLARRAALDQKALQALAAAGALSGLSGNRHLARWAVAGVTEPTPLDVPAAGEGAPMLRVPRVGEDVVADYASMGLSLRSHPVALIREQLEERGVRRGDALWDLHNHTLVRVVGLVVSRQRPATASGVTFVTLEDDSGSINIVVWPSIAQRQRRELLGSRLLCVIGAVQREGKVLHVVARRLEDFSHLLSGLTARSRDFR